MEQLEPLKEKNIIQSGIEEELEPIEPKVNIAREFSEITRDFTDPKDLIREAISNAYDANATEVRIEAYIDETTGVEELVITVEDNGDGMDKSGLQAFFDLGNSTRVKRDNRGRRIGDSIGYKGHGTKVYLNSREIEIITAKDNRTLHAVLKEPKKNLNKDIVPKVELQEVSNSGLKKGTKVIIKGYNNNQRVDFDHETLKDYLYWFTKHGSMEGMLRDTKFQNTKVYLKGLGYEASQQDTTRNFDDKQFEILAFGHIFARENHDLKQLKVKDPVEPMKYFVKKWVFADEQLVGIPGEKLDFVFFIEGDGAKREYNKMLRSVGVRRRDGDYLVVDRYGLWVCRDYIPIQTFHSWVSEKTEWTKYHAFVNCQALELTANRGNVENTPRELLFAIEQTVRKIFEEKIKTTEEFKKYESGMEEEQQYKTAKQEEEDFADRRKNALKKKVARYKNVELLEPRQEIGVLSLFLILKSLNPKLFKINIVDYDTKTGYDALVREDDGLPLNRSSMKFVEFKKQLKRDFNHSFKRLSAVVCWSCQLSDEDIVQDLTGEKRKLKITPKTKGEPNSYTKYMLISETETHNIEAFVLKEYLKEKLKIEFKPRIGRS